MRKLLSFALACSALASFAAAAEPVGHARRALTQTPQGGVAAGSSQSLVGSRGAAATQRGFAADGNGNANGSASSAFTTANGANGQRNASFDRNADGSAEASAKASASGNNGSASRSGSYSRSADGSASGERSTSVTNANTGVTVDGRTTYTKGSGVSRSATCKDANGQTVACPSR